MIDELPALTPEALAVIRNASDTALAKERRDSAKRAGPAAAAVHLACVKEEMRREDAREPKIIPIANRMTLEWRYNGRIDHDHVARVLAVRRRRDNAISEVRMAPDGE